VGRDAFLPLYRVRLLHRVVEISCLEDDWRAVAAGPMEDVIAGAGLPHFDLALAEAHVRAESDLAFRRVLEAAASGVWH